MFAALSARAPMCNIGGRLTDVWSVEKRGIPMAMFSTIFFNGPCLRPMVGGWIEIYVGWRRILDWVLVILIGVSFFLTLFIPETLAPFLLRRKAEALQKPTGNESYRTLAELEQILFNESLKIALVRPFLMLFQESTVIIMSFYLSIVYGLVCTP